MSNNYKLGLKWIYKEDLNEYFKSRSIRNMHVSIDPIMFNLTKLTDTSQVKNTLKLTDDFNYDKKHLFNLFKINENMYQHEDNTDKKVFKRSEMFIKRNYRTLREYLYKYHDIHINNSMVSRAWVKLYEIYNMTNFFGNLKSDNLTSLHICEAPGNFVKATQYYTKHTVKKNLKWSAQTLVEGGLKDNYKFMEKTKDHWDYGPKNTGDIINHDNLLYYIKKYKGVDFLTGDCGKLWDIPENIFNLGVHQLIYALLIPRIGGNFVIKTYTLNLLDQYLALLCVIFMKYEKVYLFKSSRNISSPEMYIIGIGFKGINDEETKIILEMAKRKDAMPFENIPKEFRYSYEHIINEFVLSFTNMKSFIIYLANNQEEFNKLKHEIVKSITKTNHKWIKKHLKHLENSYISDMKHAN